MQQIHTRIEPARGGNLRLGLILIARPRAARLRSPSDLVHIPQRGAQEHWP